jgi:arylsulfatase A-like enzyme
MAEILSEHGYLTVGIYSNHVIGGKFGFGQGFERWVKVGHNVSKRTDKLLRDLHPTQPVFVYAHTMRPHSPYRPDDELRNRFAAGVPSAYGETHFLGKYRTRRAGADIEHGATALYDAEVATNDRDFSDFLEVLKKHDVYENSLIVFLSDHGEELWDHDCWGHGHTLYEELTHVPLIIKSPHSERSGETDEIVRLTDILPTVLDSARVEWPHVLSGLSLITGESIPDHRIAGASLARESDVSIGDKMSVREERWKLIRTEHEDSSIDWELFDLDADPAEARNVAASFPIVVGYLRAELFRFRLHTAPRAPSEIVGLDDETVNQLRVLGYVE